MRIPGDGSVSLVVVGEGMDAADNWIADKRRGRRHRDHRRHSPRRALSRKRGVRARPSGKPFTDDKHRHGAREQEPHGDLRSFGEITGGPPPLDKRGRSLFLEKLDEAVNAIRRRQE
jgi:uncharacterized protein YaiI (UPF0178 family)